VKPLIDPIPAFQATCLSYETELVTPEGARPIGSLVGRATLLVPKRQSGWGTWQEADIRLLGNQDLLKVILVRRRVRKVVHTTAQHHWVTKAGNTCWRPSLATLDLKPGDVIPSCRYTLVTASKRAVVPSPFAIAHGFVFGDGSIQADRRYGPASVDFYGTKDLPLLRYFALNDLHEYIRPVRGRSLRIANLPRRWKEAPPLDEARSYLLGWLAGYFAADGHVSRRGQAELYSANADNLTIVRNVCYVLGVRTSPVRGKDHPALGGIARIYSTTLYMRDLPASFWLLPHHLERVQNHCRDTAPRNDDWTILSVEQTERNEEVFGAMVSGTGMCTLADNVVTGGLSVSRRRVLVIDERTPARRVGAGL
jgi:DNA primase